MKASKKGQGHLLLPTRARSRPPKEIPIKDIIVGILAPIMLEIDRHSKSQIDPDAVARAMPQRRNDPLHVTLAVLVGSKRHLALGCSGVEI